MEEEEKWEGLCFLILGRRVRYTYFGTFFFLRIFLHDITFRTGRVNVLFSFIFLYSKISFSADIHVSTIHLFTTFYDFPFLHFFLFNVKFHIYYTIITNIPILRFPILYTCVLLSPL